MLDSSVALIWVEAEHAELASDWQVQFDVTTSNGQYIEVPDAGVLDWSVPEGKDARLTFAAPQAGSYVIWGLTLAPTSADNSFFVSVDDGNWLLWDLQTGSDWGWGRVTDRNTGEVSFDLSADIHSLVLKNREDGSKIDRLLITDSTTYVPTGLGEAPGNRPPIAQDVTIHAEPGVPVSGQVTAFDADQDTLTFSLVDEPAHGTVDFAQDGSFVYTPPADWPGEDSFTFQAWDGEDYSQLAAVSMVSDELIWLEAESGLRQSPWQVYSDMTASGTSYAATPAVGLVDWNPSASKYLRLDFQVDQGGDYVIWGRTQAPGLSDNSFFVSLDDGQHLLWDLPVENAWGWHEVIARNAPTREVFTLSPGPHTLTFTMREDGAALDRVLLTNGDDYVPTGLGEYNDNAAPVADDAGFVTDEDTTYGGTLSGADDDGDELTFWLVDGPSFGTSGLATDGTFSYVPAADYAGGDSFTFRVHDGWVFSDAATVAIEVLPINDAPLLADQSFDVDRDTAANGVVVGTVTASDIDADDTLTYRITAGNTDDAFAIDVATGAVSINNVAAFDTTVAFDLTVEVTDIGLLSDTATVSIAVLDVNDPPTVENATFAIDENSPNGTVLGSAVATDPDIGDVLTYTIIGGNTSGAFAIDAATGDIAVSNSAALDYENAAGFELVVQATDIEGLTGSGIVTAALNDVNEAPTIASAVFTVSENTVNGEQVGTVVATDPDAGDTLSFTIVAGNTDEAFAINSHTGTIMVHNAGAVAGQTERSITLTVEANDSGGLTDAANVTIHVSDRVLTGLLALYEFDEGGGNVVSDVSGVGSPLDLIIAAPANVSWDSGTVSVDAATVISSAVPATKIINAVTATNEITIETWLIPSGTNQSGPARIVTLSKDPYERNFTLGADYDRYNIRLRTTTTGNNGLGTTLSSPAASLSNSLTHVVYTRDSTGTATVYINGQAEASAVIGGDLSNWNTDYHLGLANEFTGDRPWLGKFYLVAIYGQALTAEQVAHNYQADAPRPPVVDDAVFSAAENAPAAAVVGTVSAADPDTGDTLTYAIVAGNTQNAFVMDAALGTISVGNAEALDYETTPSFQLTVEVTDMTGLSDTAEVVVDLQDVNEPPTISDVAFSVPTSSPAGTSVAVVEAADPDAGDSLTFDIVGGNTDDAFAIDPATGELTVNNPLPLENGSSFALTVTATDTGLLSDAAVVTIYVSSPPSADDAVFEIDELSPAGSAVGAVTANDPDPGDVLSYAITAGNDSGAFGISQSTGLITVADPAALDYETTPAFDLTVEVTDSIGLKDSAAVTVNLNDVNEAPVIQPAQFRIRETDPDGSEVGTVLAGDPDTGDELTYSILAGNVDSVFAIDLSTGIVSVNNAAALDHDYLPMFNLTVGVTDSGALADQSEVTVYVSERVIDNLLALYTFEAGSGAVVRDISLAGEPLDLIIAEPANVSWTDGALSVLSPTIISSGAPAGKISTAVAAANEITIEAWIEPANVTQDGPARVMTISNGAHKRNFTLGQGLWGSSPSDLFNVRLRTTTNGNDGSITTLSSPAGSAGTSLTHVVFTRDSAGLARLYVNSALMSSDYIGGDLANWNSAFPLALANEIGVDRPWLGTFHLAAVYGRALAPAEIEQNYFADAPEDSTGPIIDDVTTQAGTYQIDVSFTTDEYATVTVEYGLTSNYEIGEVAGDIHAGTSHSVSLENLQSETTYHLRIVATDLFDNTTYSADIVRTTVPPSSLAPVIDLWYGEVQNFGQLGNPQEWVNVLGQATDPDGVASLTYALNGGWDLPLSMGPDLRRLEYAGDFNVEIARTDLLEGSNTVTIKAVDALGNMSVTSMTVDFTSDATWPTTYTADWGSATEISEIAQVADGLWTLDGDTVRPVELGYDRIIAIGDVTWTDFEVTVPVTIHGYDPAGFRWPSGGPAVSIVVRWQGHYDWDGSQPRHGWWPMGAIAGYSWAEDGTTAIGLLGNSGQITSPEEQYLELDVTYIWKVRAETLSDGSSLYRLKIWQEGTEEPAAWDVSGIGPWNTLASGSVLLLAHHSDVSFGSVTILPI